MRSFIRLYITDNRAATAIEYTLIAAGISLAIAGAVYAFGGNVYDLFFEDLPDALNQ